MKQEVEPMENMCRREFCKEVAAGLTGAIATIVPIAGSLTVVLGPLLRKSDSGRS